MMRTTHGTTMSPRMERLWRYLRHERKIPLTDFSTDNDVERNYHRLQAALDAVPDDGTADALRRDIASIMRRRPTARVHR